MTVDAAFSVSILFYLAILVWVAWGALLALRGDFWRADQRMVEGEFQPGLWPTVAVVVPARNEADVIEESLLLTEGAPGAIARPVHSLNRTQDRRDAGCRRHYRNADRQGLRR